MYTKLVPAIVLCGQFIYAFSQPIKPLHIGDTLQKTDFTYFINDQKYTGSLPDVNGKLTILDFWATWCSSCIKALPKVEALQHELGDRVQFVLVNARRTREDSLKTRNFFTKWKERYGSALNLPSVEQDTLFSALFRHSLIPHYVWIDGSGKVVAFTSAEELTAANIKTVLEKAPEEIAMKNDQDGSRFLFTNADLPQSRLISYTIFLRGRFDGLPSGNRLHRAGDTLYGRGITNTPLKDMYLTIVREIYPDFIENRILLEVKDPSKWTVPATDLKRDLWYKENMYNLEVILPVQQASRLYSEMLRELNRNSGYYGKMESKNIACMVLSAPAKTGNLRAKGGKTEVQINNEEEFRFKNVPIKTLIAWLNNCPAISIPVIDETGIDFPVDMDFPEGLSDLEQISRQLQKYGLVLQKTERNMEVFVIRESK